MNIRFSRRFFVFYLIGALFVAPGWYLFSSDVTLQELMEIEAYLFVIIISLGLWLCKVNWKRSRVEKIARIAARSDNRGFFLVLRSFSQFEYYETDGGYIDMESRLPASPVSILPVLGKALNDFGIPLLIGKPRLFNSADMWPGIIAKASDQSWRYMFDYLSKTCRAIILVPANSSGSIEEIDIVTRTGLWQKTIVFIMPPIYSSEISRYDGRDDPHATQTGFDAFRNIDQKVLRQKQSLWRSLQQELVPKGIHLPDYDQSGFLYLPNEDLSSSFKVFFPYSMTAKGILTSEVVGKALDDVFLQREFPGTPIMIALETVEKLEQLVN
jgi:hypothetical protein